MRLQFIGIDPPTGSEGSPTVWVDEDTAEIVLQGWLPGPELHAEVSAWEVPGHAVGVPPHEGVIRIPARMVPMLREACNVAEAAELRRAASES